jgi:thiol-disulfide isomerase/thioredoxin
VIKDLSYKDMNFDYFSNGIHVLFFYLPGCSPCNELFPKIEKLSELYKDSHFHKLTYNSEEENFVRIAETLGITGYPTISVFIEGELDTTFKNNENVDKSLKDLLNYFEG